MAERKKNPVEATVDRIFAGAASPFADLFAPDAFSHVKGLPNIKGSMKPVVGAEQVPSAIYSIARALGAPIQNDYLDRAAERARVSEDQMRKVLNVPAPKNIFELAQELGGSVLVPGAGATKATTGVKAAVDVAKATPIIPKAAKTAANAASEVILPFRQGTTIGKAVPAAVGVGGGLTEVVDAAYNVPEYTGIKDVATGNAGKKAEAQIPSADDYFTGLDAAANPSDDYFDGLAPPVDDYFAGIQPDISTVPPAETGLSIKDKALIGAAGLSALGLGVAAPSIIRSLTRDRVNLQGGDIVGTEYNPQKTGPITNTISGIVQSDQAVRQALKKDASTIAKPIMARLDLVAPASVNQRTIYTLNTGQFPNSNVDIGPIGPKLNAIASSYDPEELGMISRGLMAKSALNTINNASLSPGNTTNQIVQPLLNDYTPAELKAFADVVDNDPRLRAAGDVIVQAYRGMADYALERGRISKETYDKWITANPDYVHLSASFADTGDTGFLGIGKIGRQEATRSSVDSMQGRSLEEGGGVQAGAVADPMVELPKQIRATIRDVEQNASRVETLRALDGGGQYGVKKVSEPGAKTITVYENGKETHYEVPDNALRYQLELSPAVANNAVASVGRAINKLFIQSTVGRALNPLFSLISASYEGTAASISKQKGYHLGLINEKLANAGLPRINTLDPTGGIGSIPIGTVRYLWDSGIQQLANEASQSLINDNHLLARLLPDMQTRQALADRLMLAYEGSIKGIGQREGVFSSHIYSHEDTMMPLQGIEGIMPDFAAYASRQAYADAAKGDTTLAERVFAAAGNANVALNSQWWARAFSAMSNSVRESVKYQGLASNLAKAVDDDSMSILASQTRRLGGDMGQRGGNEFFNTAADWSTFVNTAIQPIAEIGKRIKDDPAGLMINLGSVMGGALMTQYLAAAMDPDTAERIRNATDEENASRIYFPGGMTVPMEQTFRVAWGPMVAVMNEISGLNDGQIDPNFIGVFSRWAEEGFALSEETKYGAARAAEVGLQSANPLSLANIPALNAGMASQGVNLGLSRYAGAPVLIKEPSEFNSEDRAMTAKTEAVVNALLGGTISNYIQAMADFNTAIGNDVDLDQAMKVAMSRIEDKSAKSGGPAESLIFKGYEKVINPNDSANQLMYKKREGIELATQVFRDEIKYPGMSGANPKVDRLLPTEAVRPEYRNTMLYPIGAVTYKLNREIRQPIAELNMLRDIDKAVQDRTKQFSTTIEQRNRQRNELIERRRQLTDLILFHMNEAEELIRQETGDPSFSYNTMDINKYKAIPYGPASAPPLP